MEQYIIQVPASVIKRRAKQRMMRKWRAGVIRFSLILFIFFLLMGILFQLSSCSTNVREKAYLNTFKQVSHSKHSVESVREVWQKLDLGFHESGPTSLETTNLMSFDTTNMAEFTITAYCACEKCCGKWASLQGDIIKGAAGIPLITGVSVAVDTDYIPLGTILWDEYGNEYVAADTGSGVVGYWADIYMGDHQAAREVGMQTKTLYWGE